MPHFALDGCGGRIYDRRYENQPRSSAPGGPQGEAAQRAAAGKVAVFGHAVWLMVQSAAHKHLFLTDMEGLVLPPLALGRLRVWQFRIWRKNNMPVAFASRAWKANREEGFPERTR